MLPSPALTFTLPSIHDDTVLDCRVYFPSRFLQNANPEVQWRKKAAIVAHPYAPLGGCYDDPVVELLASQLLKGGFMVGTFNFRGAGSSNGRTSWTSKAEIKDYTSMIGFMIYLLNGLLRPQSFDSDDPIVTKNNDGLSPLSPIPSQALPPLYPKRQSSTISYDENSAPDGVMISDKKGRLNAATSDSLILMAGYSYGALITTQLPDLLHIIELFSTPIVGTAASEIRLRAQQLAKQQNQIFARFATRPESKSYSASNELNYNLVRDRRLEVDERYNCRKVSAASTVRFGGEETDGNVRRASQDGRHSLAFDPPERVRRSIDRVRSLGGRQSGDHRERLPRRQTSSPEKRIMGSSRSSTSAEGDKYKSENNSEIVENMPLINLGEIKTAYLLVSPLQGLVTNLATMWSFTSQMKGKRKDPKFGDICDEELKLTINDTFAIFGDHDVFTSSKKLRSWASKLSCADDSKFIYTEISSAGHFWHEDGVAEKMKYAVGDYIREL